ncbi:MAG: cardiolipin synthase [Lentisphaeria bacterium]
MTFLPRISLAGLVFMNLRNHRKILCVDGALAFIGGINIREANLIKAKPKHAVCDIHFKVSGPVIDQIAKVFKEGWYFAAKQKISFPRWSQKGTSSALCRILPDGPQNIDKLKWSLINSLNAAQHTIRIVTPYFIPDHLVLGSLQAATLRGVRSVHEISSRFQ